MDAMRTAAALCCCLVLLVSAGGGADAALSLLNGTSCDGGWHCWFAPPGCLRDGGDSSSCVAVARWQVAGPDKELVRLQQQLDIGDSSALTAMYSSYMGKYTSFAWSSDIWMGEDTVVECTWRPTGELAAYVSWNDGTHNYRFYEATAKLLQDAQLRMDVEAGKLLCSVDYNTTSLGALSPSRGFRPGQGDVLFDVSTGDYYLQLAFGALVPYTDELIIHPTTGELFPWTTEAAVAMRRAAGVKLHQAADMFQSYPVGRDVKYAFGCMHGVLMLFGWWVFGGVAMLMARYYKPMWPSVKVLGTKVWYQLHRDLFIVSIVLQIAAFILIFVGAGRFFLCTVYCTEGDYIKYLHSLLGVIVTGLCILQPFFSWIRPGPGSAKRDLWNWFHWMTGQATFLMATIVMFTGVPLGKTGLQRNFDRVGYYLMGAYVLLYVLVTVLLEVVSYGGSKVKPGAPTEMKMSVINGPVTAAPGSNRSPANSLIRLLLLVAFTLISIGICVALSYMLVYNVVKH